LPEPVTLNARQTKQVAFLDQKDVAFQRLYAVGMDSYNDYGEADAPFVTPDVVLRLENKTTNGLGKPLPSGALSAIETAEGRPTFAGEQAVRDVAVGEPMDLVIGRAMDVRTRPRLSRNAAFPRTVCGGPTNSTSPTPSQFRSRWRSATIPARRASRSWRSPRSTIFGRVRSPGACGWRRASNRPSVMR
jgi:hypothetical protein